jgi:O-methyltransferase
MGYFSVAIIKTTNYKRGPEESIPHHFMIEETYAASVHKLRRALLDALREVKLTQLKEGFSHEQLVPWASYAPWRDDPAFVHVYEKIKSNSLVDLYRCYELWDLCRQTEALNGDILEVGVWRGASAAIIGMASSRSKDTHLWLADTFIGVPKAGERDSLYKGGEHADTSEQSVRELLATLGVSNFTILRGVFPDDTGGEIKTGPFKFCHIDVDTYQSARDVFEWVWPHVVVGGIVVFDDYGFRGCEGVTSLVNELKARGLRVFYNLNGHAVICQLG